MIHVQAGQPIPRRTVTIVGRRIRTIAASTAGTEGAARLPCGPRAVDGRGKYLIPGLWDAHVHSLRYVDIAYPLFLAKATPSEARLMVDLLKSAEADMIKPYSLSPAMVYAIAVAARRIGIPF